MCAVLANNGRLTPHSAPIGTPGAPGHRDDAWIIFTSGSTGTPKGAMLEHRGMLNHFLSKVEDLDLTSADVVAQTASQCFDISVWQFLAALVAGGRTHVYPDAIARDLIVSGPSGAERCTLSPVALVDGDRTFERVAILCGGHELPAAPHHSPTGNIAQAV